MFTSLSGKQILILETEPIVCLDLVLALEQIGATVLAAPSVPRARELLELRHVAAAVIDVDASSEARALCALLREKGIAFVVHSRGEAVDLGAASVIPKPARASAVAAAVASALQCVTAGAMRAREQPRRSLDTR